MSKNLRFMMIKWTYGYREFVFMSCCSANGRVNESWMNIKLWRLEFLEGINVSEEMKDLLREMLTLDPKQRIDWTGVFGHGFRNSIGFYEKCRM